MNVQEAAKRLGKSAPTIRRWIRDGKLEAAMVDGAYDIPESALNDQSMSGQLTEDDQQNERGQIAAMRAHIESLERQLTEKDGQLAKKDEQLDHLQQLLMLSERRTQRLIEYREPWYRRVFRRRKQQAEPSEFS